MKHGKYSKTKEVKPYKVIVTVTRYDGISEQNCFFSSEENAKAFIEITKSLDPKPNQYYYGTEYKIEFIGYEKYI